MCVCVCVWGGGGGRLDQRELHGRVHQGRPAQLCHVRVHQPLRESLRWLLRPWRPPAMFQQQIKATARERAHAPGGGGGGGDVMIGRSIPVFFWNPWLT